MAKKAIKKSAALEIGGKPKLTTVLALIGIALAVIIIAVLSGNRGNSQAPTAGPSPNSNGCLSAAGYVWCEEKQKCLRLWEENCSSAGLEGAARDPHGCIPSAGYVWCEGKSKCLRTWEEECVFAQAVSGERDEHGCIPSAGYLWCEESRNCTRPWEENCSSYAQTASAAGMENNATRPGSSASGTSNTSIISPGSLLDSNGCIPSAGYVWCQEKNKCLRLWEENCSESQIVGGNIDPHGCIPTAGYTWCESLQTCILPWETACNASTQGNASTIDENGCASSEGYAWCQEKNKCLRLWEENCTTSIENETDAHGCALSQGYMWCEEKQRCIRPIDEDCTAATEEENLHCDGFSKVYRCGSYIKVVSAIAGKGAVFYKSGFQPVECEGTPTPDYVKPLCRILMDNCGAERRVC